MLQVRKLINKENEAEKLVKDRRGFQKSKWRMRES